MGFFDSFGKTGTVKLYRPPAMPTIPAQMDTRIGVRVPDKQPEDQAELSEGLPDKLKIGLIVGGALVAVMLIKK